MSSHETYNMLFLCGGLYWCIASLSYAPMVGSCPSLTCFDAVKLRGITNSISLLNGNSGTCILCCSYLVLVIGLYTTTCTLGQKFLTYISVWVGHISQLERQLITKTGHQDEAHQAHLSCAGPPGCWWCCAPLCFVWPNYIR